MSADTPPAPDLLKQKADLISELPTRAEIYLPTAKIPLQEQIAGLRKVKAVYECALDRLYRPKLHALREKYAGTKRAFIIGNGPSLNDTDLSFLENEVTFCVNGFFLKMPELGWTPTFYVVEDHLVAEDRSEQINALEGPTKLFPAYLAYCLDPGEDGLFFDHRPRKSYPHGFDFSTDASLVTYTGCTVTFTVMQLAHWLGFEELYLVGVDASYAIPSDAEESGDYGVGVLDMRSDDPNHFHPDYFGKGYRWHDPQVDKMVEAYKEARSVCDRLGRPIFNATVGGELEVFQRVDYSRLFPAETAPTVFPRVAIVDMTPPGDGTATGNLKQSLFKAWPAGQVMYCSSHNTGGLEMYFQAIDENLKSGAFLSEDAAVDAIKTFDPDIVLYRPVPEKPMLHSVAKRAVAEGYPYAVWIMDDWLARLPDNGEVNAVDWTQEVRGLIAGSALNISISEAMSTAYLERYGADFVAVANGIAAAEWPKFQTRTDGPVVIRYAGGLAPDMSLDSVLNLAAAVEQSNESDELTLEINTRRHWFDRYASLFRKFKRTAITCNSLSDQDYRKWLSESDITVIAYNFDDTTTSYTRFSMANKLPECLASGAVTLVIGPTVGATIAAAEKAKVSLVVTSPGVEPISQALTSYQADRLRCVSQAADNRRWAFEHYAIEQSQETLRHALASVSNSASSENFKHKNSWSFYSSFLQTSSAYKEVSAHVQQGRLQRITSAVGGIGNFYRGWRGLVAFAAVVSALLPMLSEVSRLFLLGPAVATGLLLIIIGHVSAVLLRALDGR